MPTGRSLKARLREQPLAQSLWTPIRAALQERAIRADAREHARRADERGVPHELAREELARRLAARLAERGIAPCPDRELHIVLATPLGAWERHNIPPALEKLSTLATFYPQERGFDAGRPGWIERRGELDDALLAFVRERHRERPVDVLVSYLSGTWVSPATVRAIGELGIFTCALWYDDRLYFRGRRVGDRWGGAASLASAYDLNLTSAEDSIVKYHVEGGLAMFWPPAANPDLCEPLERPPRHDVSFIGTRYGARAGWVRYLRRRGVRVEAFGRGWPNGTVSGEEMVEIYASSRINLGFNGIGYSMRERCLKERDFSVPMSGQLLLCGDFPELHRVYEVGEKPGGEPGEEVAAYRDRADCLRQIRRLLADPERCERIREAGRRRALRDHTWERRFRDVLEIAGYRRP